MGDMADKSLLNVTDLVFRLGPEGPERRVCFDLPSGGAVWVKGPSGAGKTTLLRVLAGLRPRTSGSLRLDGRSESDFGPAAWRRRVSFIPQKPVTLPGTVTDNLSLAFDFASARGVEYPADEAAHLMTGLGLQADMLTSAAGSLSGGEQARVGLIRSLLTGPRVILADEPLAHLDAASREAVCRTLAGFTARTGAGVVFVSHDPLVWPKELMEVGLESGSPDN